MEIPKVYMLLPPHENYKENFIFVNDDVSNSQKISLQLFHLNRLSFISVIRVLLFLIYFFGLVIFSLFRYTKKNGTTYSVEVFLFIVKSFYLY